MTKTLPTTSPDGDSRERTEVDAQLDAQQNTEVFAEVLEDGTHRYPGAIEDGAREATRFLSQVLGGRNSRNRDPHSGMLQLFPDEVSPSDEHEKDEDLQAGTQGVKMKEKSQIGDGEAGQDGLPQDMVQQERESVDANLAVPGKFKAPEGFKLRMVPPSALRPASDLPRKEVDEGENAMRITAEHVLDLHKLGHGVGGSGILEPVAVLPDAELGEGHYLIVDGVQRWHAVTGAGLKEVPVLVNERLQLKDSYEMATYANVIRQNLDPVDEAEAIHELCKRLNQSYEDVARRYGKSKGWGQNRKELAESPHDLKSLVRECYRQGRNVTSHVVQVLRKVDKDGLRQELVVMTRKGASLKKVEERWKAAGQEDGEEKPRSEAQKMAVLSQRSRAAFDHLDYYVSEFANVGKTDEFLSAEKERLLALQEKIKMALVYLGGGEG